MTPISPPAHDSIADAAGCSARPVIRSEAPSRWSAIDLAEIWRYRELFFHLTWRNVKVRYKQTILGILWAVMQPLFTMIIFTIFFGRLAKIPSNDLPYPIFAYAGILVWGFFANAVSTSANSLVGAASLITRVYFPRMLIPASYIGSAIVDFSIAFVLLIGLMIWYGVALTPTVLLFPLLLLTLVALALGLGMWLGAVNVRYRDVQYTIPFVMQLWMFASPVIYPSELVPERWRWLLTINPMTGIIENARACLLGRPEFNWQAFTVSVAFAAVILVGSMFVFRRMEDYFADLV